MENPIKMDDLGGKTTTIFGNIQQLFQLDEPKFSLFAWLKELERTTTRYRPFISKDETGCQNDRFLPYVPFFFGGPF